MDNLSSIYKNAAFQLEGGVFCMRRYGALKMSHEIAG